MWVSRLARTTLTGSTSVHMSVINSLFGAIQNSSHLKKQGKLNSRKPASVLMNTPLIKTVLITATLSLPLSAVAQTENASISVVKSEDAQIFAEFTDQYPAVLNYFSKLSEQELISFYQQAYGEVIEQERKRGRLTLHFAKGEEKVRVVVSQQNKKRQVDILIEKK